jgi:hypothetical protein
MVSLNVRLTDKRFPVYLEIVEHIKTIKPWKKEIKDVDLMEYLFFLFEEEMEKQRREED